jgi:type II secretory pathway pseudopilin PulG
MMEPPRRMSKLIGMKLLRNRDGFTILETMIALAITILLLGLFVFRSGGLGDQKRIETAKGDLRAIQKAIHAYYLNNSNAYPAGSDWQSSDLLDDSPQALNTRLYDPFQAADTDYGYETSGNGTYYVVFSYGPDRTADITGINNSGQLTGTNDDDIFLTNGMGTFA